MSCGQHARLLIRLDAAVAERAYHMLRLTELRGVDRAKYSEEQERAECTLETLRERMREFESHLRDHGC
jgi:hypothetical protein